MPEKIMLIDGNSIINRTFYGVPLLTNPDGRYTNAVYGFLNILFKLIDEEAPDYLAVAFDLPAPTFRHIKFAEYKGTRKGMPDELAEQLPLMKEMLTAMGIAQFSMEGYEADDILGTLANHAQAADIAPIIVSGDRDMLQLASETTKIRIPKTKAGKTETEDYFSADVVEKYGVTPTEFIEVKALMGDASDNIPGVPGIGEKTAVKIIQEYKNIENAISHAAEIKPKRASENLAAFSDQARLSRFLAVIEQAVPLSVEWEALRIGALFTPEAYTLMKQLDFKSMLSRFSAERTEAPQTNKTLNVRRVWTSEECTAVFSALQQDAETACLLLTEGHHLLGLSLYQPQLGGVWMECGESLSAELILSAGRAFLEQHPIIAHDAKNAIHLLHRFGIIPKNIRFDTAIAAYILNPTRDTYEYDDLAGEFLQELYPSLEELLGKGKSRRSFLTLSEAERAEIAVRQAEVTYRAKQVMAEQLAKNNQTELYYEVELPLTAVLADMEQYGIRVDEAALLAYQAQLAEDIDRITGEVYTLCGEAFNLNSPKQLGVILFEKLGLPGGKKTKTGYSTAADVLDRLKNDHPAVAKILEYRQLAKLKSTYADGLLAVMDPGTKKIYSTFHQTITATGRLSSTEPNLQNIPVRLALGRELRKVFIPTDESYCFLDADYSQIELRVLAHIAGDPTLIEAFRQGQDIHRLTASQVFHVPFDEVTDRMRGNAKAVNFGIVYGIGAFSLSQDLHITRQEAESYIAGYFQKYPKIKEYMDKTIADATENGYVSTLWHRRRAMPELSSKNFVQRSFGERVAMNMPIQGTAADIIKIAMVRVHRALKERGLRSRLILQVHDELLVEAHIEERAEVAVLLQEEMQNAAALAVPLLVEVKEGRSWYEAK